MRAINFSMALAAALATVPSASHAVNLNPEGLGQVLIYPYYTTNGDQQTLLSVVNTTGLGKAIKVRFLEGHNGRKVLDFNLYLSPFDVWTAAIFDTDSDGAAKLITADSSCTVPQIKGNPALNSVSLGGLKFQEFGNTAYVGEFNDSGPNSLERTREGYVELIEMASITGGELLTTLIQGDGTPPNCAAVVSAWTSAAAPFTLAAVFAPPTGGLLGGGAIVNTSDGTLINYNADAIDGFSSSVKHTFPSAASPSLADAEPKSFVFENGALIASTWGNQQVGLPGDPGQRIDAVSAVFQAESLLNEFAAETNLSGKSEWVINFPTKRFYVDRQEPIAPFNRVFNTLSLSQNLVIEVGAGACESIAMRATDREIGTHLNRLGFSSIFQAPALCFQSQVLAFQQTITGDGPSNILASQLTKNVNPSFGSGDRLTAGAFRIDFTSHLFNNTANRVRRALRPSVEGHRIQGLPVTGFWAVKIDNRNARPGVRGFYGTAYSHRRTRACTIPAAGGQVATGPVCAKLD